MSDRGGNTEVTVPGRMESTENQMAMMAEKAKAPAKEQRKDGDPETAFKNAATIIERTSNATVSCAQHHGTNEFLCSCASG